MIRAAIEMLNVFPQSLLQLLMRVAIMPVFWRSGWGKAENMEQAIGLFRDEYQLPILPPGLAAYLGTAVELAAPALILAGLATRLATLPLIVLTLTIQFMVYPVSYPDHLLWFAILVFILTRGPGPISIDALLASRVEPSTAAVHGRPR
ncbi:MAG: DoxX family protein [Reyranella sp.]|nr:DoxX family protein [Reyranella sp.]